MISIGCRELAGNKDYLTKLNYFLPEQTNQFPKNGNYETFAIETDTSGYYNSLNIIATIKVSKDQFNKTFQEYKKLPLIENSSKNILVVNSFLDGKHYPEPTTIFCGEPCINKNAVNSPVYILPNFYFNDYADSTTLTRLPNKFKHVIIEQKNGIFSNKIQKDISTMPINYFHGYSKGISFNQSEHVVIYWTVIW